MPTCHIDTHCVHYTNAHILSDTNTNIQSPRMSKTPTHWQTHTHLISKQSGRGPTGSFFLSFSLSLSLSLFLSVVMWRNGVVLFWH